MTGASADASAIKLMSRHPDAVALDQHGLTAAVEAAFGDHARSLLDAYRDHRPDATPRELLVAILSAAAFRIPLVRLAERKVTGGASPTFTYLVRWRSPVPEYAWLGSYHGIQTPMFFDTIDYVPLHQASPTARALVEPMSSSWISFARDGTPSHPTLPAWPPYSLKERATMVFDDECRLENDPDGAERPPWDDIARIGDF